MCAGEAGTPCRHDGERERWEAKVNETMLGEPLLTAEQVAAFLGVSPELVYKLRRTGRLKAVKLGALYRWRPEVVRAFLETAEGR